MKDKSPIVSKETRWLLVVGLVSYSLGMAMVSLFGPLPDGGRMQLENERLHAEVKKLQEQIAELKNARVGQ